MPTSLTRLSPLDLALVGLYLVGITVFGLRFSARQRRQQQSSATRSLKSYFLADNAIPWWAIALSIVSAETSTLTIISIPGVAFAGNLGFLQVVLGYMLGRIVVAALFLPRYIRGEMLTAYQLIDRRFGTALHRLTAGLFLLTRAAAEGVRVFAISIVVGIAIGTGDVLSIAIISALTLLYTFEGGMAAVIWTDVVQMALCVAGTVVALFTLGAHVPGGWQHIHAVAAPLGKFHWLDFSLSLTRAYTFWAGVLGGTFLTMASHGTDQLMVQRMLAARSLRESRLALLSSGVVIFVQFLLFLVIGVGLFVFYGMYPATFASPDRIFPTFIVREMPHGVAGLLIAAILAAAMSNLSAALNSLASTTVVDFYVPLTRRTSNTTLVSRAATVFWALVLFAIAVYSIAAGGKGHVVETGLSIASVAYGCLLGVFLLGTLTRYATQAGAIVGMVCGLALNLALWQASLAQPFLPLNLPHIAFTWYVLIGSACTFAVGLLASAILPKPRARIVVATLLLLLAPCLRAQATPQTGSFTVPRQPLDDAPTPDFTPVSTAITQAIAAHKLPGAVVLIGHNDHIVFEHAYGNRTLEPTVEPMTTATVFDMASLTKVLVTTTAILQLYEAHKLELDTPVARYLPAFAAHGKDAITVRELLTHYSGLAEDVDLKDSWGLTPTHGDGTKLRDKAEGIRRALDSVLYGPPARTFRYSDINFITLGALVEQLSGEPLDQYATRHIFIPLGMTHTGYRPFCDGPAYPAFDTANTAPTAHDDQGTAATNPGFDQLLRGVVHDPTTRRMGGVAGHAGVFSTAEDTARFAQALLDKLLHNTGPFPLTQATLQLATSPQAPATAVHTATIFNQDGTTTTGVAERGLGWDLNTAFSRPRGTLFPITTTACLGSFGHTGFTGTSLWIDPTSDTYVILLANAIHPRGAPPISPLRGEVATAAARALHLGGPTACSQIAASPQVLTGIDVLEATHFAALTDLAAKLGGHLRIGLVANQASLDSAGNRTIDLLAHAGPAIELTTLFAPEHGLSAAKDSEHLGPETDPATHLPVISLYGPKASDKHPRQSDLRALDAIVIDLWDAGVRFWTYETLTGYVLEAAAEAGIDVVVLDRPNPIGGVATQGPTSDPGTESYTNFAPIPLRHGLTLGELARTFNARARQVDRNPVPLDARAVSIGSPTPAAVPPATQPGLHARLTVVPMQGWQRTQYFADTGLTWTPPSPNLRTARAASLYPALGLIEQTNVSVGRGTATPFEHFGAAWITDAPALTAYLTARHIPGVLFAATQLTVNETPEHYPFHGQAVAGIALTVTDHNALDTPELGIELLSAFAHLYPKQFELTRAKNLLANGATLEALKAGRDPREIAATWHPETFRQSAAPYLLYH